MRTRGFWDSFLRGPEQRLGDAEEEVGFLQQYAAGLDGNMQRAFELVRTQAAQIRRLQATVEALTDLLDEAGVLREETLVARVEDALRPRVAAAGPQTPYRDAPVAPASAEVISCPRCAAQVPAGRTSYTADGALLCDACASRDAGP